MPNILDTEAVVVVDAFSKRNKAIISKIAGIVGDQFIKVYPVTYDVLGVPSTSHNKFFGFSFSAESNYNILTLSSTIKEFPLSKGDYVLFHLSDSSLVKVDLTTSGFNHSRNRQEALDYYSKAKNKNPVNYSPAAPCHSNYC